jgi:mono/diheme cytochrome c family protein
MIEVNKEGVLLWKRALDFESDGVLNALPSNYTDDDAANVLTFVYNSWGNPGTVVSVAEVKAARAKKPSKRGK